MIAAQPRRSTRRAGRDLTSYTAGTQFGHPPDRGSGSRRTSVRGCASTPDQWDQLFCHVYGPTRNKRTAYGLTFALRQVWVFIEFGEALTIAGSIARIQRAGWSTGRLRSAVCPCPGGWR
jgi:hypothetical protein